MPNHDFFEAGRNHPRERSWPVNWRQGDRVLAPWEPTYLYAGTLEQVTERRALIQFDDGDSGWVDLANLQPLILKPGQRVHSRRKMGPYFFPGEIREVVGEQIFIEFDDGKEEEGTAASLRIPCQPRSGAQQVSANSHQAFLEYLQEGSRVWAVWNDAALFAGTVSQLHQSEAHIEFDDGDRAWVQLDQLLPLEFILGMFVIARHRDNGDCSPATISDTEGHRVQVRFEDGREEWTTASGLALPMQSLQMISIQSPPAETTPASEGWNPVLVLMIGGISVAAVAALFFLLGRR